MHLHQNQPSLFATNHQHLCAVHSNGLHLPRCCLNVDACCGAETGPVYQLAAPGGKFLPCHSHDSLLWSHSRDMHSVMNAALVQQQASQHQDSDWYSVLSAWTTAFPAITTTCIDCQTLHTKLVLNSLWLLFQLSK